MEKVAEVWTNNEMSGKVVTVKSTGEKKRDQNVLALEQMEWDISHMKMKIEGYKIQRTIFIVRDFIDYTPLSFKYVNEK